MAKKALIIHGPNLNLLGLREPSIYGSMNLLQLDEQITEKGMEMGLDVTIRQSNHEGEIVEMVQKAPGEADIIIINPGAYTHTSVAIRDAILSVGLPVIEVHLSNIYKREEFRRKSFISDIAVGVITGFGPESYLLALQAAANL
ncbi:MAG: type II 3-dehydroquinate dehydratase [Nitrospinae bacterium]|nr:type II 3-dehydroquinate dehydratase [Nitrospinota bacterium]